MTKKDYRFVQAFLGFVTLIFVSLALKFVFDISIFDFEVWSSQLYMMSMIYIPGFIYDCYMKSKNADLVERLFIDERDERSVKIKEKAAHSLVKVLAVSSLCLVYYLGSQENSPQFHLIAYYTMAACLLYAVFEAYYKRKL